MEYKSLIIGLTIALSICVYMLITVIVAYINRLRTYMELSDKVEGLALIIPVVYIEGANDNQSLHYVVHDALSGQFLTVSGKTENIEDAMEFRILDLAVNHAHSKNYMNVAVVTRLSLLSKIIKV